jgi:BlaI family transcriptional regulator, penicillinase repressor
MENAVDLSLGKIEAQFADIIWEKQPISAVDLSEITGNVFQWKKTTTFTVIKRLCDKGIFKKENGLIVENIPRNEFYSMQSKQFVNDKFNGSLPAFVASFANGSHFSREEINQLKELIDKMQ